MKNFIIIKVGISFLFAFLMTIYGAYSFAIGNRESAGVIFLVGIISFAAGIAWLIISLKRLK